MKDKDVAEFYEQRVKVYSVKLAEIERQIRIISLLRLASLLISGFFVYAGVTFSGYCFLAAAGFFYLFLLLVKRHSLVFQAKQTAFDLLALNTHELRFKTGDKTVFETGSDIDITDHLYALDLDIFGTGSLFQSINRSATLSGRAMLAVRLLEPFGDEERINNRKQAVADLKDDIDWRQQFYVLGKQTEEKPKDRKQIRSWLDLPDFFQGRSYWKIIAVVASLISLTILGYCIVTSQLILQLIFLPIIVNGFALLFISKSIKNYFDHFGNKTKQFRKYADLFNQINDRKFVSSEGLILQKKCLHAGAAFKKLFQLSNLADQRANQMVAPIMNGFFMFDLWIIHRIEGWRKENKEHFEQWIDSLVEIDTISSMSGFAFNHPEFTDALVTTSSPFISAKGLGHPLMNINQSVKNDYEVGLTSRLHVITGSNMAGKSTFIRAVGVNHILACNGIPVCATEFRCSVMQLITSIRITDSLEENASYFKAELNRLDRLVSSLKTNQPFIVLLDEILRGTNSDDKRLGTQSFLLKLMQYNCVLLLATHDLSIGKLQSEFPGVIENYCFESQFSGDGLLFDYRLRKGISSSTNATFLMKRMGLID